MSEPYEIKGQNTKRNDTRKLEKLIRSLSPLLRVTQEGSLFPTPSLPYIPINLLSVDVRQGHHIIPDHGHMPQNGRRLCRAVLVQQAALITTIIRDLVQLQSLSLDLL